jgi:DNA-directed RNA polymerase subunit RPC12/RpoP
MLVILGRMAGPRRKVPIKPTTLGSMSQNVQATLAVSCPKCRHKAFVEVDPWPRGWPVALFRSIMECSKCGTLGADVRPVWTERRR